jgi:hypothetical protein
MSNYFVKSRTSTSGQYVTKKEATTQPMTTVVERRASSVDTAKTTMSEAAKRYGATEPRTLVKRYALK